MGISVRAQQMCKALTGVDTLYLFFSSRLSYLLSRCGWIYIEQAYLYHFTRTDVRHNFSAWFYPLYVTMPAGVSPWWNMLLTASQLPVHLALAWRYGQRGTDLPLCFCLQVREYRRRVEVKQRGANHNFFACPRRRSCL